MIPRIYWEEHGAGEPLLLITGLGYTLQMWHRTLPAVSRHFRTIVFDNRGVGKSAAPPGPYTIVEMAADAATVLDAAQVERAHVYGVSMGGMIAQELALQYPGRVRSLVLGCTACGGPHAVRAEQGAIEVLKSQGKMGIEESLTAAIPYIYYPDTPRERIEEDLAIRRENFPHPAAYQAQLQAVLTWKSHERLSQIQVPTLVIHGESDRLVPAGNGKLIAESIRGAQLTLLPHASHIYSTDQPEAAQETVLSFLLRTIRR
ncbi:MAG TPA: alpha/beta fold hydrolase [Bryobacteraceae bacterium]|nr:alpha/beta fold hydrolase [Bryobacteraceae bacterium]